MKTKEGVYEKTFINWDFIVLGNYFGRSTGWVCLANL